MWRDGEGRVTLEHWSVSDAAHAWSGGDTNGSYTEAQGPDASELIVRFLEAHARSAS